MPLMPNPWSDVDAPAPAPTPISAPEVAAAATIEPAPAIGGASSGWEPDDVFMRELELRLQKMNEQAEPTPLFLSAPSAPYLRALFELGGAL